MSPPPKCCNPFKRKNHNSVKNKLIFFSENRDSNFSGLYGLYVCATCKGQLYRNKNSDQFRKMNDTTQNQRQNSNLEEEEAKSKEETDFSSSNNDEDSDYVSKSVDNKNKRLKLAAAFQEAITASPAKEMHLNLSEEDNELIRKSFSGSILNNNGVSDLNYWINDFKLALSRVVTRQEKIALLTTIPVKWSVRQTAKEFNISRRMVSIAYSLRNNHGYNACPNKKKGRAMNADIIKKVKDFFLSDDVSRVMPGMKDVKSVVINGKRQLETKRLLLGDIKNLHADFLNKYSDVKISLSAFRALRPQQCIPVGAKGTHNVCVCKTHGNIRLKFKGLKEEFARKSLPFETSYHDCLEEMVCSSPSSDCYLGICTKCPGTTKIVKHLKTSLQNHKIKTVSYNQWLTTDRYIYK